VLAAQDKLRKAPELTTENPELLSVLGRNATKVNTSCSILWFTILNVYLS
jgi:hypothetical protein